MVQGYYTLQEAAQVVGLSLDELRQMAQKGQLRSFQDRGTLRFRIQDIQELARQRGQTSDPELALGDFPPPAPKGAAPSSASRKKQGPKSPSRKEMPDVFDFDVGSEEKVDLGEGFLGPKSKSSSKSKKKPAPAAGTDSDVRLVADGSDVTFSVTGRDSNVKLADSSVKGATPPRSGAQPTSSGRKSSQVSLGSGVQQPGAGQSSKPTSPKPGSGPQPADSGVRLVPMDSDSDVKIIAGSDEVPIGASSPTSQTDSNVRLDRVQLPADSDESNLMLTEEINLDEEIRKQEEREKPKPAAKMKAKSELKVPSASPFELSESELKMPSELLDDSGPKTPLQVKHPADSSDFEMSAQMPDDGSSDFDLTPGTGEGEGSPLSDSEDFSLNISSEHALGNDTTELTSSSSGISLSNPVDAGISLEGGGSDTENIDFDLSLDVSDTPRPAADAPADDSEDFQLKVGNTPRPAEDSPADSVSSEFELTLDSDSELRTAEGGDSDDIDLSLEVDDQPEPRAEGDDSEFEINLDGSGDEVEGAAKLDADSEFELTLDDSGSVEVDDADGAPQVKAADGEADIFESDFEVPALEDEGTVADSELESSDFDLALDDSDLAGEEESGSQVVALDEDEEAATEVDSDSDAAVVDDVEVDEDASDFKQIEDDVDVDADAETDEEPSGKTTTVVREKLVEPAPWGVLPVIFMLPCVVIMFLVSILGYEMVQSSVAMRPPGPLTVMLAEQFGQPIAKR